MKWIKELDEKIINLVKNGKSYNEISDEINMSPNSIRNRCFRLNIKSSSYKKDKTKKFYCVECNKEFIDNKDKNRKFCSNSCSAIFNNKTITRKKVTEIKLCLNCKCELVNKNSKYCSQKCQIEFQTDNLIEKWKNGEIDGNTGINKEGLSVTIRKYIIKKYNNKCSVCGWNEVNIFTGVVPLEVDHIDGNHLNSKEENLRPLCPSCHSLTEFYGGRNKGRGRKYRRK